MSKISLFFGLTISVLAVFVLYCAIALLSQVWFLLPAIVWAVLGGALVYSLCYRIYQMEDACKDEEEEGDDDDDKPQIPLPVARFASMMGLYFPTAQCTNPNNAIAFLEDIENDIVSYKENLTDREQYIVNEFRSIHASALGMISDIYAHKNEDGTYDEGSCVQLSSMCLYYLALYIRCANLKLITTKSPEQQSHESNE